MCRRILLDLLKYSNYTFYAAICELKNNVMSSYLSWLWLVLDPFLHMIIYSFIVEIVFNSNEPYLPVFIFIGRIIWSFFSNSVKQSVKIVKANRSIIMKTYIPKYVLVNIKMLDNLLRMCVAGVLLVIMAVLYGIELSSNIFLLIPIIVLLWTLTFSFSTILLHFGVFIEDLINIVDVALRLGFYLSGVFFSLKSRLPSPYGSYMVHFNPVAYIIDEVRNIILHGDLIDLRWYVIWLIFSICNSFLGIYLVYTYESKYAKVI